MSSKPTAIFVHGAWHNGWSWHLVREHLDARGIESIALDLPMVRLDEDAQILRDAIDGLDGDAVVIGHSWGGSVMTLGASGATGAKQLIYVCAVLTEVGHPVQLSFEDPGDPAAAHRREQLITVSEGRAVIEADYAIPAFYHDVDPTLAAAAVAQLRPFYVTGYEVVETELPPAWSVIPTTYVVCTDDRMIQPVHQREMARRAGEVVEWHASHSPFLSHPELVADLVEDKVRALERAFD